ncbi:putative M28 family peptidase (homolog to aminopeptidase YwaD) (plasmid) [Natrialba magadii ATCC 43099]|uniref:Carboxypeptidase Q n=1 Tax=Natrialba magadii (strain ATCC 43099 / DSM 3394 / CCM 3739 / CIP 104546 / IAM 13178 / JCM 8861 / NBRC 102185 / NCIMB 2190 / MS3) TaxID=547559 RepID=D3T1R4_NATMM|nr:M28 family peptidase [Natrialba magadii]ADD07523.1 putative M28 family peptidase (homolog to aminopeptidase YwaD) [Natrialba magadii ATCC 43099]ELY26559.1 peptidase M28 [Natrialba magadii ATCC 43099]
MPRLPESVLGDAYSSTNAWDTLIDLVEVENRMAGQAGEREGADVIVDAFEDAGLNEVGIEEFEIPGWWRGSSVLELPDRDKRYNAPHQLFALPGCTDGTVEAELVDVGHGTGAEFENTDIEGKVVMVSSDVPDDYDGWLHRMEKYASAIEGGAEAFVFRNHVAGCLPPTGEVGYHARPGELPAVGISKELGARLERYCEEGPVQVTLSVDCRNEPTTSQNVVGELGPDTQEEVWVTAHHDSHDIAEGANDNGVGSVLVAEIGRLLAQMEADLDVRTRFVTFGSEEIGLCGAYHAADTVDVDRVKAIINIDGAGRSGTLHVRSSGFSPVEEAFRDVAAAFDVPLQTSDTVSPHGDQWAFVEKGVPGVMVSSASDEQTGRGWGHTHADTLDKLDSRTLREIAVLIAEGTLAVSEPEREIPHREPDAVRDDLSDSYVRELKVGNRWNYEK